MGLGELRALLLDLGLDLLDLLAGLLEVVGRLVKVGARLRGGAVVLLELGLGLLELALKVAGRLGMDGGRGAPKDEGAANQAGDEYP